MKTTFRYSLNVVNVKKRTQLDFSITGYQSGLLELNNLLFLLIK